MFIDMELEVFAEELDRTVASVFETMIGMEIVAMGADAGQQEAKHLLAAVQITGTHNIAIVLDVTPVQACELTGHFLSMDAPPELTDEVRDVVGELANMIGGNIKSVIAPEGTLSMPDVVDGTDFNHRICGSGTTTRRTYDCAVGEFWVSLIQF